MKLNCGTTLQAQSSRTASVYNQKFEFPYPFEGQQCHFVVTSISGHLIQADFDERSVPSSLLDLCSPVCFSPNLSVPQKTPRSL